MASGVVDCKALGEVEVKGFAETGAGLGPGRAARCPARRSQASLFAGRRSEKRLNSPAWSRTVSRRAAGKRCLVRGEAGIGKSRLIAEFESEAQAAPVLSCARAWSWISVSARGRTQSVAWSAACSEIPAGSGKEGSGGRRRMRPSRAVLVSDEQRVFLNDLLDLHQPVALHSLYDAMDNRMRNEGKRSVVTRPADRRTRASSLSSSWSRIFTGPTRSPSPIWRQWRRQWPPSARPLLVMTSRVEGDPLDRAWRSLYCRQSA